MSALRVVTVADPRPRWAARRQLHGRLGEHAGLAAALASLSAFLWLRAPNFATSANLLNVLREVSFLGVIALGMTLVIVAGEIDISVGSAIGFSSALFGVLVVRSDLPFPLAALAVLGVGAAIGAAAGFARVLLNVPSFIVTLALLGILRGLAFLVTDAVPVVVSSPDFRELGNGRILGIPIPGLIFLGLIAVFWLVANRTVFGRSVYAVGGNAEAARLSGIPVDRVRVAVFAITGGLAALAGVLLTARLGSSNPTIGAGAEFDVISAVIIGGAALSGGRGSVIGTLLGVSFVGVLANGMVLLGVSPYTQQVVRGVVVFVAVVVGSGSFRRRGRPPRYG